MKAGGDRRSRIAASAGRAFRSLDPARPLQCAPRLRGRSARGVPSRRIMKKKTKPTTIFVVANHNENLLAAKPRPSVSKR
jgi:hypothetical protein